MMRQVIENNLKHSGWNIVPASKANEISKRYASAPTHENYRQICVEESLDGLVLSRFYSQMGLFFLKITMPDKPNGNIDPTKEYVMQMTDALTPDSFLSGLGDRLLGNAEQALVALFGTNSMVPTMPYRIYLTCDETLSSAILKRSCRVLARQEADAALRRGGVLSIADLTCAQAHALAEELKCVALVQLTVKQFYLQEAMQFSRKSSHGVPEPLMMAEIGGEIHVWNGDFKAMTVIPFRRVITSDEVDGHREDGRLDKNFFGQAAMRSGLEQVMRDFRR